MEPFLWRDEVGAFIVAQEIEGDGARTNGSIVAELYLCLIATRVTLMYAVIAQNGPSAFAVVGAVNGRIGRAPQFRRHERCRRRLAIFDEVDRFAADVGIAIGKEPRAELGLCRQCLFGHDTIR